MTNAIAALTALVTLALAGLSWVVLTTPWVAIIEWRGP